MKLFRTDIPLTSSWDFVQTSIDLIKSNFWAVFYLTFLPSLALTIGSALISVDSTAAGFQMDTKTAFGFGILLVSLVWTLLTFPGLVYLELEAVKGNHPTAMESFKQGLPKLGSYVALAILIFVVIVVGFALFIIPGLILLRGLVLSPYYLMDHKIGAIDAMKLSFNESKPHAGYIWSMIGVGTLIGLASGIIGAIPLIGYIAGIVVGLVYLFGPALRYKTMPAVKPTVQV